MKGQLNTVEALIRAKNHEGARRIVRKALEDDPEDRRALRLSARIELEAKKSKDALRLARAALARYPMDAGLRIHEYDAVVNLRRKGEAKKLLERFETDFPHLQGQITTMRIQLDAISNRVRKINQQIREMSEDADDPYSLREMGIVHHKLNDLFRADRMMREAHPHFPADAELNAALATNCFQLLRLAETRRFARLALAADPTDRRMALLVKASWGMYWPPFMLISAILLVVFLCDALLRKPLHWIVGIALLWMVRDLTAVFYAILETAAGFSIPHTLLFIGWMATFFICINPVMYDKYFRRDGAVKLRRY